MTSGEHEGAQRCHAPSEGARGRQYPRPASMLQEDPAPGMTPANALTPLDWQYGENGRLIYNCEPYRWIGGGLCR